MRRNAVIAGLAVIAIIAVIVWGRPNQEPATMVESDLTTEGKSGIDGIAAGVKPSTEEALPKPGFYAPAFTLPALEGTAEYSVGGKRDKLLLINFWAAWCGPCELEAPDLVDIYDKHKDKLDLYAVNATNYDKLREAKDFVKEQGFVFPVLTDAKGTAGNAYKVISYPTNLLVDTNGVVIQRVDGLISRERWEEILQQAYATM